MPGPYLVVSSLWLLTSILHGCRTAAASTAAVKRTVMKKLTGGCKLPRTSGKPACRLRRQQAARRSYAHPSAVFWVMLTQVGLAILMWADQLAIGSSLDCLSVTATVEQKTLSCCEECCLPVPSGVALCCLSNMLHRSLLTLSYSCALPLHCSLCNSMSAQPRITVCHAGMSCLLLLQARLRFLTT